MPEITRFWAIFSVFWAIFSQNHLKILDMLALICLS
jgi:hypothetical protein